jgi:hypothetical protein
VLNKIKNTLKAWSATILAAVGWTYVVIDSPQPGVTGTEWLGLVVALLASFGVVYAVPNIKKP